jgi:hypothetical protein
VDDFPQGKFSVLRRIDEGGVAIPMVQWTPASAFDGHVLLQGKVAAAGTAAALREQAAVHAVYIGKN